MAEKKSVERPDPRPHIEMSDGTPAVVGVRCVSCNYPSFADLVLCPLCSGLTEVARFDYKGEVFASTCVRVRVPDRQSPRGLAYVDLQDGPRVLVETSLAESPVPAGTTVEITGTNEFGDLVCRSVEVAP